MTEINEIWKPVVGYEGLYECSNMGRVKSVDRYDNLKHFRKGEIKTLTKDKNGYLIVTLCKDGKEKKHKVHRLVALHFIPNPNNYPMINHKDENPSNPIYTNLEWCDGLYNQNYGTVNERRGKSLSTPILEFDLNMNFIKKWDGMKEIERETGILYQNISKCCRGVRKQYNGSIWKYYDKETYLIGIMNNNIKKGAA